MKTFTWLFFLILIIISISCKKINRSNFEEIQMGMTRIDVENILGKSENGTYSNGTTQILLEYNNGKIVSRTYLVKNKNSSDESILEGTVAGIIGFSPGQTYLTQSNTTINDYELIISESTKYVDTDNQDSPFELVFGALYKVYGKFESYSSGSSNTYKGKILVNRIEKVFLQSELNPKDALAFAERGNKKLAYKDYKGATSDFTKAIEIDPTFAKAYYCRAYTLTNWGAPNRALADFTKAIELEPDTLYYLGRALVKSNLKDRAGAQQDLEKASKLGSADAKKYLDKFFK